ncbi:hypothetical protein H5410_002167 [Solanum commersonii]|uniref:Uncharacterized protein n=1 Tax=Solanum commersonii TaxID=4109 RepID=A0A9J6B1J6_SOLCO|nr:hypothetical protein H5410_002167 [Solanum commersonii]
MTQSHLICPQHNHVDDSLVSFCKIYQLFFLYLWKRHGFPQDKSNGFEAVEIFLKNYKHLMRKTNTNVKNDKDEIRRCYFGRAS